MKVIPREPCFGALPTVAGIIALEESPRGGNEVTVLSSRRNADVMNIEIIDSPAYIFPRFAAVETPDDAPVFQTDKENFWITGMDENMPDMLPMRRPGITPVFLHLGWQLLNTRQLLPAVAAIFAAVQVNRFDTDIDHAFIGWVHRNGADISFEHPAPALAGVIRPVKAILSNTEIDNVGLTPRAIHSVNGSALEGHSAFFPRAISGAPNKQSFLGPGINSHWTWHDSVSFTKDILSDVNGLTIAFAPPTL